MLTKLELYERRRGRTRYQIRMQGKCWPRLSVFRSNKHIYAQVIDDAAGHTLAAASSRDKELRQTLRKGSDREAAQRVGELVARRAVAAGVSEIVFDRGGYRYHGRVQALADGARAAGLKF